MTDYDKWPDRGREHLTITGDAPPVSGATENHLQVGNLINLCGAEVEIDLRKEESPQHAGQGDSLIACEATVKAEPAECTTHEVSPQVVENEVCLDFDPDDPSAVKAAYPWYESEHLVNLFVVKTTFGRGTVFIPMRRGEKVPLPQAKGFPQFTNLKMSDPNYLRLFRDNNIAILTGPNSEDLISVDLDSDEAAEVFRMVNADLCGETIKTTGARGANFWFRVKGDYPVGKHDLKDIDGGAIGELRAGKCITVVHGLHPKGIEYKRSGLRVVECDFENIIWPEDWMIPWVTDPVEELVQQEGHPFSIGRGGAIKLNEPYFVAKFAFEHLILHDPGLGFFIFDGDTGVWNSATKESVKNIFSRDIMTASDEAAQPGLQNLRTDGLLSSLTNQLAGRVEERDAFRERRSGVIHTLSGMLHVQPGGVEVKPFDPSYHSLGCVPFEFVPDAGCPRFIRELLQNALPENDIELLQKYCGQILLGKNLSQTILILEGIGGAGKGQIGNVIDLMVGTRNVAELRTEHLASRFEIRGYVGKHLLAGRDVPGDFLNKQGASALKKLTGGDLLTAESKGKDTRSELTGDFNILITANTRLLVNMDGDKSAWKRRLLLIPFVRTPVDKPIPDFGKKLVMEEGQGILAWMIEGAQKLLQDLDTMGRIYLDPEQSARVSELLSESDSVMSFVTIRLTKDTEGQVPTSQLWDAYLDYCADQSFMPVSAKAFERRLPAEMLEAHNAKASENIQTGVGGALSSKPRRRGYKGVRILRGGECDLFRGGEHPHG